jgi:putative FmdB family regulatory protein
MPIYEYECKKCGRITEALQGFNDPPIKKCKYCKTGKLEKLISLSSFQLTGSGWYSTDYAKGPGIPPHANDLGAPAKDGAEGKDKKETSGLPSEAAAVSGASTYDSIKKDTAKAKTKSKGL